MLCAHGTTCEELPAAAVKGLCDYQRRHPEDIGRPVPLTDTITLAGGAVSPPIVRTKKLAAGLRIQL